MKTRITPSLIALATTLAVADIGYGYHDTLNVWVNGVRITAHQIRVLENLQCGPIPSGRYWLNPQTGIWGYEGGRAQGRLGDACRSAGTPYYRSTPGGVIGSDGETSYYYDSPTGCSVIPGQGLSC